MSDLIADHPGCMEQGNDPCPQYTAALARIRELETDSRYQMWLKMKARAEQANAERDAIEATTIERCINIIFAEEMPEKFRNSLAYKIGAIAKQSGIMCGND
jgi:predicted metal-binding protein